MECNNALLDKNRKYWSWRAPGYSKINRHELTNGRHKRWMECLQSEISGHFPNRKPETIRALDIGTGPGFFAILLAEMGHDVTAIDLTEAMLREARANAERAKVRASGPAETAKTDIPGCAIDNTVKIEKSDSPGPTESGAGRPAGSIRFMQMNAEELNFAYAQFDVIVSRNLTWNLSHPEQAYAEWIRVLKPGGLLLNFDANWYAYLFDEDANRAYEQDRINSAAHHIEDRNVGENFEIMEEIARDIPLSKAQRPAWDLKVLQSFGMAVSADEQVWQQVWTEEEKINFASTPMFLVRAVK